MPMQSVIDLEDKKAQNHLQCMADDVRFAIDGVTWPASELQSRVFLLEVFSDYEKRLALKNVRTPTIH